jgi:3-oxoacyl-[acyl-carrier-protein] synthase-3
MRLALAGIGYQMGSRTESNRDRSVALGLDEDWLVEHTGIVQRRVCIEGENVFTLGVDAVQKALKDAGLTGGELGHETILLHIQNGYTQFAPPAGIVLANAVGLTNVRVLGIDGVCAEPIAAIDLASGMLDRGQCDRVIISASVDFALALAPDDVATAGLFGAGAGAVVIERARRAADPRSIIIRGSEWRTKADHAHLGVIPIRGYVAREDGIDLSVGYYEMNGQGLTRVGVRVVPQVIRSVLDQAGWKKGDVDMLISHQPNANLLEILLRALKVSADICPMPVREIGNMGPASLLVNLGIALENGSIRPGSKCMLTAFGLGFSCGATAVEFPPEFARS